VAFLPASLVAPRFDVAPWRLSGNVYGALLNHRDSLVALGAAVLEPPYRDAPKGVVLYLKPRHALVGHGGAVLVDDAAGELEVRASLGLVIGMTACAVAERDALDHVAGFVLIADGVVPHASHFRPQIRAMARDRSCVLGDAVVPRREAGDPDATVLRVFVDGVLAHTSSTADHMRSAARLIAEVSDFMTLVPGDVLFTGSAPGAPRVRAGARVRVEGDLIGALEFRVAIDAPVTA
jgi:5-oxopent-3-ene-1,2,5-tricarboxylate decarboxylase/2-hydroxyhepta-2,4-diene-1,7-dioate isomerase